MKITPNKKRKHDIYRYTLVLFSIWFISCFVFCSKGFGQQPSTQRFYVDLPNEIVLPQRYVTYYKNHPITIDGESTERAWHDAPFTRDFIDIEGMEMPELRTRCKMLWDFDYLYIYAEMQEPHVAANLTQHDTVIFYDKDFEVFIDPSDDTYNYMELEINALNTTWDLYLDRPYRVGGRPLNAFEFTGLQHAVAIQGTINDAGDTDVSWSVELAIPIDVVMQVGFRGKNAVKAGEYWRMNFSRVHWYQDFIDGMYKRKRDDAGQLHKEENWVWSNQKVVNMHQPEFWGYVFFSERNNEEDEAGLPSYPEDYLDKQVAYALFRATRTKDWKILRQKEAGYSTEIDLPQIKSIQYQAEYHKTAAGFEIRLTNLETRTDYVIDQTGWLKKR